MLREPDEFLHERYATNNCSINDMDDEFEWLEDSTSVEKECNEVVNVEPNIFGNESKNEPKVGMLFSSKEEVYEYYRKYAKDSGFGIYRRSSTSDEDGLTKYDVIVCFRAGKSRAKCNLMKPNLLTKTECQAKVRATLQLDGAYMLTKVVLEHNHGLSPAKARYFRSNKKLDDHVKRRLELNDQAGIGVGKNFNSLVVEAGGYENLSFVEKDCRNYIEKARKLRLGEGDALAIHNYFVRMQEQNPSFFYVIDFDSDSRIRNLFWVDARSRAAYESFGDVVSFDTTYLTNKYDMPFAPFVGVNHHGQSVLLGCGLLSSEDTDTFVWLFQCWLNCMSNCPPKAIITDQCQAMKKAIEIVFPNSRHRWCLWHIMKKIPEKLKESHQPRLKRFERLMSSFSEVAMVASNYDEVYNMVFGNIQELMSKVLAGALKSENRQLGPCSSKNSEESNVILSTENTKVYSPKSVRRKGRPPTKRKESTCDQKVRKANEKKKKMGDDPSSSLTPKDGGEVQNQERISLEWRMAPMFLGK